VQSISYLSVDIKPSNFLFHIGSGHGVLCDFGLCQFESSEDDMISKPDGREIIGIKQPGTLNHDPRYFLIFYDLKTEYCGKQSRNAWV
jgi:serine/threonine protein kinase